MALYYGDEPSRTTTRQLLPLTGTQPITTTQPTTEMPKYGSLSTPTIAAPPPPTIAAPPTSPTIAAPPPPLAPLPNIGAPAPPPTTTAPNIAAPPTPTIGGAVTQAMTPTTSPTLTGVSGSGILGSLPAATLPSISPTPVTQSLSQLIGAPSVPPKPVDGLVKPTIGNTVSGMIPNIGAPPPPNIEPPVNIQPPIVQPPGGPLQDFGPGDDLRGTQINPFTGERLAGAQRDTDVMARALSQGPNLTQAALDRYADLEQQTQENRQQGIQQIGRAAARLGRLGSGMVTTDLGNLEALLQQRGTAARRGLAGDIAFQESADRRANLGAGQSYEQQIADQARGYRDEARGERGFQEDQARRAQDMEVLRRQLQVQYDMYLRQLGLQGAQLYGDQAAAGSQAASDLLQSAL